MLRDFTAIDFETANRYPTSACSIGIVVVQDGEITEEFSHLIKPEPYYFNKKFIEIHGITPVMVKDAPSFYDLWGVIGRYFDTEALVAHNAGFDMSVLKACLERADLYARLPESFCTCRLSRKLVKGLPENILLEIRYVIHMIILLIIVSRTKEMNSADDHRCQRTLYFCAG